MKTTRLSISVLLSFLMLLLSCAKKDGSFTTELKESGEIVYHIDLEQCLQTEGRVLLSDLCDTLEYIVLKTPPEIIITSIRQVILVDDFIVLTSRGAVYQFTRSGDFVQQIGRTGEGPGEYRIATDVSIDGDRIAVPAINNVLFYSLHGEYIESKPLLGAFKIMYDQPFIWASYLTYGVIKHNLLAFDSNMDTVAVLPNYELFNSVNEYSSMMSPKYFNAFYRNAGNLYFKPVYDPDTIWQVSSDGNFTPHVVFAYGNHKMPVEYNFSYSTENFNKYAVSGDYITVPLVYEDPDYLFATLSNWIFDNDSLLLCDKKAEKAFMAKDDALYGITDDILNGPPFWPLFLEDQYYINIIEAYELLEKTKDMQDLPESFQNVLAGLNEDSNQLLILAKRKL